MTETSHKESTRAWTLVAQQLAMAIHARQAPAAAPVQAGPWYPGAKSRAEFVGGARVLEGVR
jgi:hypothetical protein